MSAHDRHKWGAELHFLQTPFIDCVGSLKDETTYKAQPHFHEMVTELQFFVYGNAIVYLNGVKYQVGPDDLVVYESNVIHYDEHIKSESQNLSYFLRFQEYQIAGQRPNQFLPDSSYPVLHTGTHSAEFQFLFESILTEYGVSMPDANNLAEHYMMILLYLTHRISKKNDSVQHTPINCQAKSIATLAREYIEKNYNQKINLSDISFQLNISASLLGRMFQDEVGTTPIKHLTKKRITEAKRLLAKSELSIAEIAVATGFSSTSYFSTRFKHIVGVAPSIYRSIRQRMDDYKPV